MKFYQINSVTMESRHMGIENLSINADVAKVFYMEGVIRIFIALARSTNRWVSKEAVGDYQTYL